jgi:hypothetical protein
MFLSLLLSIPLNSVCGTEGDFFFISLLTVFADEEEEQAANVSVAEQDFKFMDFARR